MILHTLEILMTHTVIFWSKICSLSNFNYTSLVRSNNIFFSLQMFQNVNISSYFLVLHNIFLMCQCRSRSSFFLLFRSFGHTHNAFYILIVLKNAYVEKIRQKCIDSVYHSYALANSFILFRTTCLFIRVVVNQLF